MKKKIFVNKDARSGFRTSLKFLFWAAIGLVVLVLFIPLTSRHQVKEVTKKPAVEKGKVVKEIPRSLQPIAESLSRGQGEPGDVAKQPDSKPTAAPEGKSPGAAGTMSAPAPAPKEKPTEPSAALPKSETPAESASKSPAGRPSVSGPTAGQGVKESQATAAAPSPVTASDEAGKAVQQAPARKPETATPSTTEAKPKSVATASSPDKPARSAAAAAGAAAPKPAAAGAETQKPAVSGGQKLYAVQIATLKDKRGAEELRKTLQKKGFEVVMKTTGDPKQGQSFILQLPPVDNMGKASTMMEQVKYVPQVTPSIVTVQGGNQ